jgi:hypothetical protein
MVVEGGNKKLGKGPDGMAQSQTASLLQNDFQRPQTRQVAHKVQGSA